MRLMLSEFPEFEEMCAMFKTRFGKKYVARDGDAQLRNNCEFNIKVDLKFKIIHFRLEQII